jgi:hypothetical protein
MKKIAITVFAIGFITSAIAQDLAANHAPEKKLSGENAAFVWNATTFDFGKIKLGVPVTHEFTFTNEGNVPLIITSVKASCGCTVTSYSKDPIEKGSRGFVKATYNAAKAGQFSKSVTIHANTDEGLVQLTIKGEVVE